MARAVASGTRVDGALLGAAIVIALTALALPARARDPLAATLRRHFVAPLIRLQKNAELGRAAIMHHETVVAAHDSIALKALLVPGLETENERLRALLGLGHQLEWGFVPADALHSRALGEEFTMTLTAGSRNGVTPFSPVVTADGIVGMVETVDPTMSIAILWAHPDFRVSAITANGEAVGIVKPHLGIGAERYLLELSGVQVEATLAPGTAVVSSGIGGVYPRGIPVGTVIGELKTPESWARTYLLRPAVRPSDVSSVLILQPKRAVAGVQTVWPAPSPTHDSATRDSSAAVHSAPAQLR